MDEAIVDSKATGKQMWVRDNTFDRITAEAEEWRVSKAEMLSILVSAWDTLNTKVKVSIIMRGK